MSRSWLSPGASVTLNCSVTDSAARWRFYWYKAVANLSINSNYSYELLPGKSNGTENNFTFLHFCHNSLTGFILQMYNRVSVQQIISITWYSSTAFQVILSWWALSTLWLKEILFILVAKWRADHYLLMFLSIEIILSKSIPVLSWGSLLCQSQTKASTCVETQRKSQHRVGCQ